MFVGLYALFGVTSAGLNPIGYLKSISTFMHRRNGLAIGLALSGTAVGAAIVPNFAQFVISEYGWRSAYLILALLPALVALPFTLLFIREPTASSPASVGAVESAQLAPTNTLVGLTVREAFRTRSFWILASTLFLVSSVINGTIAHAVPYLVDQDYSPNDAASVLAGVGLASIVGRISSGYFFDRFFASHVAVFFFVLLIIGLYLLDSVQAPNIAMFCVGLTLGFEMDMIGYLVPRYFGLKKFGQIYALLFGTLNGGGAFGPLAMGGIYAWQGSYNLAFIGFGVMLMTACVLVLRLPAYPYQSLASKSG
jgi:MFS family permease